jgi:cobalt-zinc-cadmium efflux system membrane fusion protein
LQLLDLSPEKIKKGSISNTVSIYAPIKGYINKINVKIGSFADAKNKLFEITDNSAIHADFMVYEKDVHLLKDGQKIHFTVSSLPGLELTATIFAIGKEFEPNTRAVHIHATIDGKVSGLIPGMYISGHLHTDETYAPSLPNNAIVKEGTKSFIFILDNGALENHTEQESASDAMMAFRKLEIMTGRKDDGYTEVKLIAPLAEDTQIVLNAAYYLLADLDKDETGDHD